MEAKRYTSAMTAKPRDADPQAQPRGCPFHEGSAEIRALPDDDFGELGFQGAKSPRGWPWLGNLPLLVWNILRMRGDFIAAIRRMLAQYETRTLDLKILRRRLVLTVDPELAHQILVERSSEFPKTSWEERVLKPAMEGGLIILDGEEWKTHRQAIASCFGPASMADLLQMSRESTRARLGKWSGAVNVAAELRCIVQDVMFRFFLRDHRLDPVEDMADAFNAIERSLEARVFDPLWFVPDEPKLALGIGRRFRECLAYATSRIRREAERDAPADRDSSALDVLLKKLPEKEQVWKEIRTTMGAGATTTHLLTWTLDLLARHPEAQSRLRQEVAAAVLEAKGGSLSLPEIEALPYLNAVIHEGLRLYPPAPFLLRQPRSKDGAVDGMIFVSVFAMHRDPECWEEADRFVPERWLGRGVSKEALASFVPFGLGPRVCVGKRFAMVEARVVLSEVISRFELQPGSADMPEPVFNILTHPKKDVHVYVKKAGPFEWENRLNSLEGAPGFGGGGSS